MQFAKAAGVKSKVLEVAGVGSKICNRKLRVALAALALKKAERVVEEYDPELFVSNRKKRRVDN